MHRLMLWPGTLVDMDELICWLYDECEDGGPDDAEGCVRVAINRLRNALRDAGFPGEIRTIQGRGMELLMPGQIVREIAA